MLDNQLIKGNERALGPLNGFECTSTSCILAL
jgi:hypothetical protein